MKVPKEWLPRLTPIEYFTLAAAVLFQAPGVSVYTISKTLEGIIIPRVDMFEICEALKRLREMGYLQNDLQFARPTRKALYTIDPNFKGANAGGEEHRRYVWLATLKAILSGHYANAKTGRVREKWPDVFAQWSLTGEKWADFKYAIEIELAAREHPKRIVRKFNIYTYNFHLPTIFYVPDCDVERTENYLSARTNARVCDCMDKVGYVVVLGVGDLKREIEEKTAELDFITSEPLNAKGAVHSSYHRKLTSVEDEGWGQRELDLREDGEFEEYVREHGWPWSRQQDDTY